MFYRIYHTITIDNNTARARRWWRIAKAALLLLPAILVPGANASANNIFQDIDKKLQENFYRQKTDTAYVRHPQYRWTLKTRANFVSGDIKASGKEEGTKVQSKADGQISSTVSLGFTYYGLGLGYSFNPANITGKSSYNEANVTLYNRRYGFEASHTSGKTYSGSYWEEDDKKNKMHGTVRQTQYLLNTYFVARSKKFSYPAAFSQSSIQKRSAGSLLFGATIDYSSYRINSDESEGEHPTIDIDDLDLALGAGYGHNFVFSKKNWMFHLSSIPSLIVYSKSSMKVDGEGIDNKYDFPNFIIVGRMSLVRNIDRWFTGISAVINYSAYGDEEVLRLQNTRYRVRVFVGLRR